MLVAIHQLHYLPWLRYIAKIAAADIFVALDDVQYTRNGFQNRTKIKHARGWMYLTVPVKARSGQCLDETEIAPVKGWRESHWRALECNYGRSPHFEEHAAALRRVYTIDWTHLNQLNWELLTYLCRSLGIKTQLVRSSELSVSGKATERLIQICKAVGADGYYSGSYAAEAYLDIPAMEAAGIRVALQEWQCPQYEQRFPQVGFIPDLSVADLLFNVGPASLEVLQAGEALTSA